MAKVSTVTPGAQVSVREHETLTIYRGTAEQLLGANILKPEEIPPLGRSMVTFYDGQVVQRGGWLGDGRRSVEDEKYIKVVRGATGMLTAFVGKKNEAHHCAPRMVRAPAATVESVRVLESPRPFHELVAPPTGKAKIAFERHAMDSVRAIVNFSQESVYLSGAQ